MAKNQKKLLFGIVISVGIILSVLLFFIFIGNTKNVLVATQDVKANTQITESMFTTERVDASSLPDNYLTAEDAKELVGYYTYIGFTKGSVISENNVATTAKKASGAISKNRTLLTINTDNLPSGIQAGDFVNIIIGATTNAENNSSTTVLTYQKIEVSDIYRDDDGSINGLEVVVTPSQAQKIVYAQLKGQISVSLLPIDYKSKNLEPLNEGEFLDASKFAEEKQSK